MAPSSAEPAARAKDVELTANALCVLLADGRRIAVPLAWFPKLARATAEQRDRWQLLGGGLGIHWPDVDEDISVAGLLRGRPAARPGRSRNRTPRGTA